ncbi:hypothetical protein T492DRAFT_860322, partial [Pavlovales sp. CCMP2436]
MEERDEAEEGGRLPLFYTISDKPNKPGDSDDDSDGDATRLLDDYDELAASSAAATAARGAVTSTAAAAARAAAALKAASYIDYPYEVEEIVSYRHNKKKRRK